MIALPVDLMNLRLRLALVTVDTLKVTIADHDIVHFLQPCVLKAAIVLFLYGVRVGETLASSRSFGAFRGLNHVCYACAVEQSCSCRSIRTLQLLAKPGST